MTRLIFACLLCACLSVSAQDFDLQWGKEIKRKVQILSIIHQTETGHYSLAYKKKAYYLQYYDNTELKAQFSTRLPLKAPDGQEVELRSVRMIDGVLTLFTQYYDTEKRIMTLYGQLLDEKGNLQGERKEIMAVEIEKKSRKGSFSLKWSYDKSKLLILHLAKHKKEEEGKVLKVHGKVIIGELQTLASFEETLSQNKKGYWASIVHTHITNNAVVYLATKWRTKRADYVNKFHIYHYDPSNGFERKEQIVKLNEGRADGLILSSDEEGNLIGSGFYTRKSGAKIVRYLGIEGTFFIKFDRSQEKFVANTTSSLNRQIAKSVLGKRYNKKGHLVPDFFKLHYLRPHSDGGATLIAEYYEKYYDEVKEQTHHVRGSIVVVKMDIDGEIQWAHAIPKQQIYIEKFNILDFILLITGWVHDPRIYHSYFMCEDEDGIHIFYNDHPKNTTLKKLAHTRDMTSYNYASLCCVSITHDGDIKKTIIRKRQKKEVIFRPDLYHQEEGTLDQVIIYGTRRNKDKFGIIRF